MYNKFLGVAFFGLLGMAACHNIFSKDKPRSGAATALIGETNTGSAAFPGEKRAAMVDSLREAERKYVYLTFDDGPEAGTMNCYRTCIDKGVRATFFLVGEHALGRKGRRVLDTMRGDLRHVLLANHSYTHAGHNHYDDFYGNPRQALQDFERSRDSLGLASSIVRFPGNNAWMIENHSRSTRLTRPLSRLMDSAGFQVLGWDLEWHYDRKSRPVQTAEDMAREVVAAAESNSSMIRNHVVVLAHDRMFREENYRDSLARMISILQSRKGYIFESADRYPGLRKKAGGPIAARP